MKPVKAAQHPERGSGVLAHLTSLPGRYGCGDLGPSAHRFVAQLSRARQTHWQVLPVCPVGAGNAPYSSPSSFAGSPLLVSPDLLARDGLLMPRRLRLSGPLPAGHVSYKAAMRMRDRLLREAYAAFGQADRTEQKHFAHFQSAQGSWLDDHTLFMALRRAYRGKPWTAWPAGLRLREERAMKRACDEHSDEIRYHAFVQYQFNRQWQQLRAAADSKGVHLIGDIPFYVEHDSVDVWSNRAVFELNRSGRKTLVAGVAPDHFAEGGQLWGNPLYNWNVLQSTSYDFWVKRLQRSLDLFGLVRLDHFIAFHRAWVVPAGAKSAKRGRYRAGPGADFFLMLERKLGGLPFIAEDLGIMVPEIEALRDRFQLPGMRVLQFSFGGDPLNGSRPFTCPQNAVVYTGTHDNNTCVGWFREREGAASTRSRAQIAAEKQTLLRYLGTCGKEIHWDLIRLALMSPANLAIVPLQDVMGLGAAGRMNRPGTKTGNWEWRFQEGELTDAALDRLGELTTTYGRASERPA
ncbi:MAG: 4-alpha-glucanotransferase [Vicinamibacteria bacterium]